MIKLTPQSIDDKALYNSIAAKKHKKNDHCSQCQNRTKCDTCEFSNRFKMQSLSNYIFGRYDVYQGQKESLDAIIPENQIAKDDEELLRDAYKKSADFKAVRKSIMDSLPRGLQGKCPFCMISEPNTLDHYFSETKYPEFIIYSPNLVPCCSNCNTLKGDEILIGGHRTTLHYYYDPIPTEQFVFAKITIDRGVPSVSFDIKTDGLGEIGNVITNHFTKLQLTERYEKQCNDVLSCLHDEMRTFYEGSDSVDFCIEILNAKIKSMEKRCGQNYWMVCLYKALSRDKKLLQEFLEVESK